MKFILILVLWIAVVYAGVVKWSQSEEDEAVKMYQKYCETGDSGVSGDTQWHCKYPEDAASDESLEHHFVVTSKPQIDKQIFFVQTQAKHYIHKISVHGDNGISKQDVTIYVIPPKHEHRIEVGGAVQVNATQDKPRIAFVKKHPFTFSLPDGQSHPTPYPKPFGEPFVAKSPDLDKLNQDAKISQPRFPRAQVFSVETV